MTMNLAEQFVDVARRLPDKQAVLDDVGTHSYGDLLAAAQAVAHAVRETTDRDHVGLVAPTSAAFPIAFFGILLADKVPVPLNFLLEVQSLAYMAQDAGFDTVVGMKFFEPVIDALGSKPIYLDAPLPLPATPLVPTRGDDDTAALLYTSGTLGVPKGVVLTHSNFSDNADSCFRHINVTQDDVLLGLLPLFHSFGLTTTMLLPLLGGCGAAYVSKFAPLRVFQVIAESHATIGFAVASMYRVLIQAGLEAKPDLSSMRFAIAGGEALGAPLSRKFEEVFDVPLLEGYGLTETAPVVAVNLPHRNRQGSVGVMLDWVEAQVVDDADQPLPPNQIGELWLRGKSIAPRYHNRPDEDAAAFTPDAWFRTGDMAKIDEERFLWITGRKKELIISAGENISPNEIEHVLELHPAVFEVAVLAVPHPTRGEAPKAYVVLNDGAQVVPHDLAVFCREHLPRFKVPVAFDFRPELPHSPTGKVHKLTLRRAEGLA